MNTTPKGAALSDADIEKLWKETFSTNNPFCPCDLRTFKKAVRAGVAADRRLTAEQPVAWHKPGTNLVVHRDVKDDLNGGFEFTHPLYARAPVTAEQGGADLRKAVTALLEAYDADKYRPYREQDLVPRAEFNALRAALTTQPQAEPADARIYWHASLGWQVEWLTPAPNGGQSNYYRHTEVKTCRDDGRCQYAIDHGAEGLGHCPKGKCTMPLATPTEPTEPT